MIRFPPVPDHLRPPAGPVFELWSCDRGSAAIASKATSAARPVMMRSGPLRHTN